MRMRTSRSIWWNSLISMHLSLSHIFSSLQFEPQPAMGQQNH